MRGQLPRTTITHHFIDMHLQQQSVDRFKLRDGMQMLRGSMTEPWGDEEDMVPAVQGSEGWGSTNPGTLSPPNSEHKHGMDIEKITAGGQGKS